MKKHYIFLFLLIPIALNSINGTWGKDRIKFIEGFVKSNYKFPENSCIEIRVDNCQDGRFQYFDVYVRRFGEITAVLNFDFADSIISLISSDNYRSFNEDLKRILESYDQMQPYDFKRSVNDFLEEKSAEYPLFPEGMVDIRVVQRKVDMGDGEMKMLYFMYNNVEVFNKKIKKWFLWKSLGESLESFNLIDLYFYIFPFSKNDIKMFWKFQFKRNGKKDDYLCITLEPIKGEIVRVDYSCLPPN